jgi:hypothetical protein
MNERSETRSGASHFCKFVLIAVSEKPWKAGFQMGRWVDDGLSGREIADFSFPGLPNYCFAN